jgi:Ca2+-binding RTX toxin-like protein
LTYSGEFETFDDADWIRVTLVAGRVYQFFGSADGPGANAGDSQMTLYNSAGVQLAFNDDQGPSANSAFVYTAPTSGTYFVKMNAYQGAPGSYSVAVTYNQTTTRLTTSADIFSSGGSILTVGDRGDDSITLGSTSNYSALGEQGDDTIIGNPSTNYISGGLGNDTIDGGGGTDRLFGDAGYDVIHGDQGTDSIYGGDGADQLYGGDDADNIRGGAGSDLIFGDSGSDFLDGGAGADSIVGGTESDFIYVDNPGDHAIESFGEGSDTVFTTVSFALAAAQEIEFLKARTPASTAAINLTGNEFANTIVGDNGANVLRGAGGADHLNGLLGNDVYVLENGTDTVADSGGIDTITSTIGRNLASYAAIENLTLVNVSTALAGTGNNLANTITGNSFANTLSGGIGNDRLLGGAGNDKLAGGPGNDAFVFNAALNASTNRDTIIDFANAAGNNDSFQLENAIFTRLGAGVHALNPAFFHAGAAAADANDFIVYNQATGVLSYDVNGNAAGGAIAFALLTNKPVLAANDFQVI